MHKPAFWCTLPSSHSFILLHCQPQYELLIQIAQNIQFVIQNKERFRNIGHSRALCVLAHVALAASEQGEIQDVGAAECTVAYTATSHLHCFMSGEWKLRGSVFRSKAST